MAEKVIQMWRLWMGARSLEMKKDTGAGRGRYRSYRREEGPSQEGVSCGE